MLDQTAAAVEFFDKINKIFRHQHQALRRSLRSQHAEALLGHVHSLNYAITEIASTRT